MKGLVVLTLILSAIMFGATFAFGCALYHEIQSQLTIELEAKDKPD